jgi:hypothetical protein
LKGEEGMLGRIGIYLASEEVLYGFEVLCRRGYFAEETRRAENMRQGRPLFVTSVVVPREFADFSSSSSL